MMTLSKDLTYQVNMGLDGTLSCSVLAGTHVIATGTWDRVPGKRDVYWSHGLVVPEKFRRQGVSIIIHTALWDAVPVGSVVMLSVANGNGPQISRMNKLGYCVVMEHPDGYSIYGKVKT
jgi:hypothetical protein